MRRRTACRLLGACPFFFGFSLELAPEVPSTSPAHLAEEWHWNKFLSRGLAAMPDLSPWLETRWFWGIFGALIGGSACVSIIRFLPGDRAKAAISSLVALRSRNLTRKSKKKF